MLRSVEMSVVFVVCICVRQNHSGDRGLSLPAYMVIMACLGAIFADRVTMLMDGYWRRRIPPRPCLH
jgi:hypothetical protein